MIENQEIEDSLRSCRELARLCTQNGWIDDESNEFDTTPLENGDLKVAVKFTEVVMKGAGCEGRRIPCFGYLRLRRETRGAIVATELY